MAKGKSTKLNLVDLIICVVLLLAVVMTVVGICVAWTKSTYTGALSGEHSSTSTLSQWLSDNGEITKNGGDPISGLGVNAAFAIMTVIFSGLTLISYAVEKFANVKVFKFVTLACSALLVICAIVTLITAFTFANGLANGGVSIGGTSLASAKTAPSAGVWLLTIFGVIGGGAGIFGAIRK